MNMGRQNSILIRIFSWLACIHLGFPWGSRLMVMVVPVVVVCDWDWSVVILCHVHNNPQIWYLSRKAPCSKLIGWQFLIDPTLISTSLLRWCKFVGLWIIAQYIDKSDFPQGSIIPVPFSTITLWPCEETSACPYTRLRKSRSKVPRSKNGRNWSRP